MVSNYKDLKVWQDSISLVKDIYKITQNFPKIEDYCLTNQIRRSAISVPSNVAEGAGKSSTAEYIRFVDIALGSLAELETQIIISFELNYINKEVIEDLTKKVLSIGRMLGAMRNSLLNKKVNKPNKSPSLITITNHYKGE